MKYTGADLIVDILKEHGVDVVFGYPGAANAPLYEALSKSGLRHVLTRGEQAAAHAANGYARVTKQVGVCFATSGPGATNLITGIANAYMDSIPIVAITGQVPTDQIGRDVFQEVDITGATAPFCKHNYLVSRADDLEEVLYNAFFIASTGRPGPVLIDIPIDIQMAQVEKSESYTVDIRGYKPTVKGNGLQIKRAISAMEKAKRPVILAGGGVALAAATEQLLSLAQKMHSPVVSTLMGVGAMPTEHPLYCGMVGSHGFPSANYALKNADLIMFMGARAADRAVNFAGRKTGSTVIHIDVDPAEIGKILDADIPIVGDLKHVLEEMCSREIHPCDSQQWLALLDEKKTNMQLTPSSGSFINPKYALRTLSELCEDDTIVVTEVGQNQIWTARCWNFRENGTFLTSGGLGTMGYGLPAAVGAKIGAPGRRVIAVEGDGSFQMSLTELATIVANRLDIKMVLLRNDRLGMVNELQKKKGYQQFGVYLDGSPDFCKLAEAYGIKSAYCSDSQGLAGAFEAMLAYEGPYLLVLEVDPEELTF